ncbi:unnamed protein product [Adineta ricciae]|uniref:RRM domain-containing protein n=1 Tax=Adineta ricciae TaxID=249248 RepID=A0A816BNZ6_ADIRI|nr:unnamed protein product [Adineta ricciae]CAF1612980.1 unnamed protein product [Adineta ricciae]
MLSSNEKLQSTTVYLGNTRTISDNSLRDYCSKFGLILDCSRRLLSAEQSHLVDFTFVRFLNAQAYSAFLGTSSHILDNGVALDVRPFNEILHPSVPLHVDRKICISHRASNVSLNEIKKYLRTFGTIKHVNSETNANEEKHIYVEFDSAATRNKLLKGKIRQHRIGGHVLNISALLRPTDVDLHKMEKEQDEQKMEIDDPSTLIYLEHEYSLEIRQEFNSIENQISDFLEEKRRHYEEIIKMIP